MNKIWITSLVLVMLGMGHPAFAAETGKLTLKDAIKLAVTTSPDMNIAESDYAAGQGERRQAGYLPNPTLDFEAENFAGSGPYSGSNSAELSFGINQEIQIGGKRSARIKAADHALSALQYNKMNTKLDLVHNVTVAYMDAVVAQEQEKILKEQLGLARNMYQTVQKRVTAAASPVMQRNKAKIALINAELALEEAKSKQQVAMKSLLMRMGKNLPEQSLATQDFYNVSNSTDLNIADINLDNTSDYKQQSATIDHMKSLYDLERANAIPDPVIGIGVRNFRDTKDQALMVGVSIPLPVFNLNQGNIDKARYNIVRAESERQKNVIQNKMSINEHLHAMKNALQMSKRIQNDMLPEASQAFKEAKRGYNLGKFAYMDVLDAQRTLTETRLSYLDALQAYHVNKAAIERMTSNNTTREDKGQK